jgi:4a-hydroxytetrahydrobiopterin dehydratase
VNGDATSLVDRSCKPCEGGVQPLDKARAEELLQQLEGWLMDDAGKAIYRKWSCKNFVAAMALLQQIGDLAEREQHHPDLHLTGYRKLRVELTTHAIGGLSENDFIVAAKIDRLQFG